MGNIILVENIEKLEKAITDYDSIVCSKKKKAMNHNKNSVRNLSILIEELNAGVKEVMLQIKKEDFLLFPIVFFWILCFLPKYVSTGIFLFVFYRIGKSVRKKKEI